MARTFRRLHIAGRSSALALALASTGALAACSQPPTPPADAATDAPSLDAPDANDVLVTDTSPRPDVPIEGPPMAATAPFTQWVNPFVATGGVGFGTGSGFPGPQVPYGQVRPGPDTADADGQGVFTHCAGYNYADIWIEGFSHTRMHGAGIVDYGTVALMPTNGMSPAKTNENGYRSHFSHEMEQASPGYYAVTLQDTNIRAELTATAHVAVHRYTFPAGADQVVILDAGHTLSTVRISEARVHIDTTNNIVSGYAHMMGGYSDRFGGMKTYFAARFDRPFTRHGVFSGGALRDGEDANAPTAGAWFGFDNTSGRDARVQVALATSFTDEAHAIANLRAEMPGAIDFDATRTATEALWERALHTVEITARSPNDIRTFYSALYHSLLMPTLVQDADGTYVGMDGMQHRAEGFTYYSDLSLWDTFRTLHPLITWWFPAYQRDFNRSMVAMARDGGAIDRWPLGIGPTGGMLGDSAAIVLADSYARGEREFDLRTAYNVLHQAAMNTQPESVRYGRRSGISDYMTLGYVPIESGDKTVSLTLEYSYNDWALATLADALGETAQATMYRQRARNYRNLWDPTSRFLIGRNRDRSFGMLGLPTVGSDYFAEGNAWQYLWYVPHDLEGLAELMGGREAMLTRLDEFFRNSARETRTPLPPRYYWHGNEPDIHASWIFSALDDPSKTARWTRWIASTLYSANPDGIPGNDDGGTLSAWYLLASVGLFPIAGADYTLVGAPLVTRAVLHLPGGDFTIEAPDAGAAKPYVQSATLNGMPLERARIPHADLARTGMLRFVMGAEPSNWATRR